MNTIFNTYTQITTAGLHKNPIALGQRVYTHFMSDSLYRNSIYLMASTAVMSFFGFFFWIINARLFSTEQIGLATTLISVTTLIAQFSLLGTNNALIRFLPTSKAKNEKINTAISLVGLATIFVSTLYLIGLDIISPSLSFIRKNLFLYALFIILMIFASLNLLLESVFTAYRSTHFVLVKNTILSCLKVILPFVFIGFGAYGIFLSVTIAMLVATLVSSIFLYIKFNYIFKPQLNTKIINKIGKFSFGNYIAIFTSGLPALALPIIITSKLAPSSTAHFYIALMIANLLYIIPIATTQSLFAEGSNNINNIEFHIKRTVKIILLFLTPAILATLLFGNYILYFFGQEYQNASYTLLKYFAFSGIFISINYIGGTFLIINHKIHFLIKINLLQTLLLLGSCYLLIPNGLEVVGVAWLISNTIISLVYLYIFLKNKL